jgi:hypothetical protein
MCSLLLLLSVFLCLYHIRHLSPRAYHGTVCCRMTKALAGSATANYVALADNSANPVFDRPSQLTKPQAALYLTGGMMAFSTNWYFSPGCNTCPLGGPAQTLTPAVVTPTPGGGAVMAPTVPTCVSACPPGSLLATAAVDQTAAVCCSSAT